MSHPSSPKLNDRKGPWAPWLLVLLAAACLPEGGPPAGTRLVEERHLVGVRFSPAGGENLLFARRAGLRGEAYDQTTVLLDLWSIPSRGGSATRVVEEVVWQLGLPADSRGRLIVPHHQRYEATKGQGSTDLDLVDATGARITVAQVVNAILSPARTRLYYESLDGKHVVREADGREIQLGARRAYDTRFAGETLVFNQEQELWALPPDATQPMLLVPDYRSWAAREGSPELQLVVFSQPLGPMPNEPATLSLVRGSSSRLLIKTTFAAGAVLAAQDDRIGVIERVDGSGDLRLHVFHADGEGHETIDLGAKAAVDNVFLGSSPLVFRPGTREIWCFLADGLRIVRDDGSVMKVDVKTQPMPFFDMPTVDDLNAAGLNFRFQYTPPLFSPDGRFWMYTVNTRLFLARADQPGLPGVLVQDRNDFPTANVWPLEDGRRMLVWAAPPADGGRWDLNLLEPETNQRRLLATSVGRVVIGKRRILAMTNLAGALADLRLIDLDTGQDTLLAQNVTSFSLPPPCAGCDATAPGTPVAYSIHARIPFKYDGLWRVELP